MKSNAEKTSRFVEKFNAWTQDMCRFLEDSPEYGEQDSAAFMRMVQDAGNWFACVGCMA